MRRGADRGEIPLLKRGGVPPKEAGWWESNYDSRLS